MLAVDSVLSFTRPGPALPSRLRVGVGGTKRITPDVSGGASTRSFDERLRRTVLAERELGDALRSADGSDELREFLASFHSDGHARAPCGNLNFFFPNFLLCSRMLPKFWCMSDHDKRST